VVVFVKLAQWPKKAAMGRSHPQVDAINMLSWLGLLLTGGVGWIVALVWAYTKPVAFAEGGAADLQDRLAKLEAEVAALRGAAS
jgi:hypothetical protein